MKNVDERRKLRIVFFAIILTLTVLNMIWGFKDKFNAYLVVEIVAFAVLLAIFVRICFKKVTKLEMVIYYIVAIICFALIVFTSMMSGFTSMEKYDKADDIVSVGLTSLIRFLLVGLPSAFVVLILCIIGLVMALRKPKEKQSNS